MKCPYCGHDQGHSVKETRKREGRIIRRRECGNCKKSFSTEERLSAQGLRVEKADGQIMPFAESSLIGGINRASGYAWRADRVAAIVDAVVADCRGAAHSGVVDTWTIGAAVLRQLRRLDPVTHIRFAMVHLGRRDRPKHVGWRDLHDVRTWLIREYPEIERHRPAVRLNEVVAPDGRRSDFDRARLEFSIGRAAKGRASVDDVHDLATEVAGDVTEELGGQPIVTTGQLEAEIMRSLRRRDAIAYLRYASWAKSYQGPEDYEAEAIALRRVD